MPRAATPAGTRSRPTAAVGRSIPKLEAFEKVTGRACYLDDLVVPGVLHGRTVRSTIPRGRIRKIELDRSFDWSGFTIVDHRDIPGENLVALIEDDQPLLAATEVRHADEPILLLAHESAERAEAGVRAVRIEYEPLPAVLSVEEALAAREVIHGRDNIMKTILIERGDLVRAFDQAEVILEGEYRCGHQEQLYIENNAML